MSKRLNEAKSEARSSDTVTHLTHGRGGRAALEAAASIADRLKKLGRARTRARESLLGFLVNSETRHTEGANNQISEKLGS